MGFRTHGVDVPFPQVFPADETPIFVYMLYPPFAFYRYSFHTNCVPNQIIMFA